jgi:hypothetical protein
VNVETNEQAKQFRHMPSPNNPKILNELCLLARKLRAAAFFGRRGELMVEFMHQIRKIT